jgi:phosphoribosylanthranilate isomerase
MPDTLIKICGLSTPETVDAAVAAGASHVGFVHFEPSPRHVPLERAAALRARLPSRVTAVLLLVNAEPQATVDAVAAVRPDVIQFHGTETAQWLALVRQYASQLEIWKAVGVKEAAALDRAKQYKGAVDRLLYDAPAQALPGGNGLALDWSLLAGYRHEVPWGLAGGLTPGNVAEAIRVTGAPLVDASTGLESAPGVKDVDKIAAFCQAARGL